MEENSVVKNRIEILLLFVLYLVLLPRVYMDYDMGFWRDWALAIHRYGVSEAYNHGINYFPVFVYGLYFFDLLQGTEQNIINHINSIKVLFVFFDFLPLFVLSCFRQKILAYKIPHLYLLLNVAYVFNSMVWGQIDSIYANLCFLALVTGLLYPVVSVCLFTLALNTKPQAIEFLPVLGIVWLFSIKKPGKLVAAVAGAVAIQFLLLIPFLANGAYQRLFYFAAHSVDLYNKLSISAFNIWYLIVPGNPYFINDKDTFLILSYKSIGLILFCISMVAILAPVVRHFLALRQLQSAPNADTYRFLFLGTGMLCLSFFYFNTQMHERYANPIVILFFFFGVVSGNYKLYVLASIPYFLSLDKCFPDYLPIVHYKLIFASRIIALWYTATIIYGGYLYYRLCKSASNAQQVTTM